MKENFNFVENYRRFIENSVQKNINHSDNIILKGWINAFFLTIVDDKTQLVFYFGNIREQQKVFTLPYHTNKDNYKCFVYGNLRNFPKDFVKLLQKRGLIFNGNYKHSQETTLQRLIVCCGFDISGLHIHHFDGDTSNNNIENLFPVNPLLHINYHLDKSPETVMAIIEDSKNYLKPKKEIYSKYKNDSLIFELCCLRFIQKMKIKDFSKLNKKFPSVCTLKTIFKNFTDFESYYYSEITGLSRKF